MANIVTCPLSAFGHNLLSPIMIPKSCAFVERLAAIDSLASSVGGRCGIMQSDKLAPYPFSLHDRHDRKLACTRAMPKTHQHKRIESEGTRGQLFISLSLC